MRSILLGIGCVCLLYAGEHKVWEKKDISRWTQQQATHFVTESPWAKQVTAVLTSNDSNMAASIPRSGAGSGSRGRGSTRDDSTSAAPTTLPKWEATVRWASAKPMKQILKAKLPDNFQGRYIVSVSGLPIAGDTDEMLEHTTLQLKRGDAVHPEGAYQDPSDRSTIYFAFVPSMIDVDGGKTAAFSMAVSPYLIRARFTLGEMRYLGEPAF